MRVQAAWNMLDKPAIKLESLDHEAVLITAGWHDRVGAVLGPESWQLQYLRAKIGELAEETVLEADDSEIVASSANIARQRQSDDCIGGDTLMSAPEIATDDVVAQIEVAEEIRPVPVVAIGDEQPARFRGTAQHCFVCGWIGSFLERPTITDGVVKEHQSCVLKR